MIYLDHAASTFPYVEVLHLYEENMLKLFANPSAAHRLGLEAEKEIKAAKRSLAESMSCKEDCLLMQSGATEAANTAIKGYLHTQRRRGGEVVITAGEHPAVREAAKFACQEYGFTLRVLNLTADGKIDLEEAAKILHENTVLLAAFAVNNESGAINPIQALSALRHRRAPQAKLVVDYSQAFTKLPLHLDADGSDFGIFSGHKIHAPKGIGLLYMGSGLRITALLHGGGQQQGQRSGTENPLAWMAMAKAVEISMQDREAKQSKVCQLRDTLLSALTEGSFTRNSPADGSPWILNLSFPGIRGETLLHALAQEELYVSKASSCHAKTPYSDVLQAMRLPIERLSSAIRISFDASQSEEDCREAARIINACRDSLGKDRRKHA